MLAQEDLPLDSTVLKVAHHGAKQATTVRFLEAVTPQVAVVSVGAGNRFGHPAPEVLERLEEAGVRAWRTDECGHVEVVTDGEHLWLRIGRQERLHVKGARLPAVACACYSAVVRLYWLWWRTKALE